MTPFPNRVSTKIPFMPEFQVAKRLFPSNSADRAIEVGRQIRHQLLERFKTFDGHGEQPRLVDIKFDIDHDVIEVTAAFDDRNAAILWKLTHGGAA
ncbi:hypothetical protein PVA19_04200 [Agrobacterium sp. CNPSo 3708]|uniref:hypothetical protein n=1 Tax=Agrobacterium sp. CNPSo 3708 TaxID=3028150 RepID=UPI0023642C90|nr:hypothetical protein [Agrobacterium sp. CNPSo 3708]MDD1497603.1 hypothetical protein [Agrobacterium sp. CNPSo 3708]